MLQISVGPSERPTLCSAQAGTNEIAYEDIMINAAEYRAMASEHHRLAGNGLPVILNSANSTSAWKKTSWLSPRVRNAYTCSAAHRHRGRSWRAHTGGHRQRLVGCGCTRFMAKGSN